MKVLALAAAALIAAVGIRLWPDSPEPTPVEAIVSEAEAEAEVPPPIIDRPLVPKIVHSAEPEPEGEEDAPALLSGSVAFAGGSIPADISLFVHRNLISSETLVDEEGAFSVLLSPGEYVLVVRAEGAISQRLEGVVVSAGEDLHGLLITLPRGLTISGRVSIDDKGTGIEAAVHLSGNGYELTTSANPDGAFEFDGLTPGTYSVTAFDEFLGSAERVVRAGSEDVMLTLAMTEFRGVVVDTSGASVPGAQVSMRMKPSFDATLQRDPSGPLDPSPWMGAQSYELSADENGQFEGAAPLHARVLFAAESGDLRGVLLPPQVPSKFELRLALAPEIRGRLVRTQAESDETPVTTTLALEDDPDWQLGYEDLSVDRGSFRLRSWPGLSPVLTVPLGHHVELDGESPGVVVKQGSDELVDDEDGIAIGSISTRGCVMRREMVIQHVFADSEPLGTSAAGE
jgi:hypothetical protein